MQSPRPASVVRFGTFEVSIRSGEVRKAGMRIRVQQQPMKLLELLLERPGEVVTREELRGRVWPDEDFGDFDQAVNIAIAKLRNALGDSAENPRYIETLPKRGYRFIAEVSVVEPDAPTKREEPPAGELPVTAPAMAHTWGHHRLGSCPDFGRRPRSLAFAFPQPRADGHPFAGGAAPR
jgi:DNA-binding winged helix-turn-helix (wHTH) protein